MPENKKPASVSLAEGSHGRYVVQDMKDCNEKRSDIQLMEKPDNKENWYVPDFIKIEIKKS